MQGFSPLIFRITGVKTLNGDILIINYPGMNAGAIEKCFHFPDHCSL